MTPKKRITYNEQIINIDHNLSLYNSNGRYINKIDIINQKASKSLCNIIVLKNMKKNCADENTYNPTSIGIKKSQLCQNLLKTGINDESRIITE